MTYLINPVGDSSCHHGGVAYFADEYNRIDVPGDITLLLRLGFVYAPEVPDQEPIQTPVVVVAPLEPPQEPQECEENTEIESPISVSESPEAIIVAPEAPERKQKRGRNGNR